MADDLSQADLVQIAQSTAAEGQATEDCPEEACAAVAGAGVIVIGLPPDGEVVQVPTQDNQHYLLDFAPGQATVQLIDADGDGQVDDLVLLFNAGTPEESQLVFLNIVENSGSSFQIGELVIGFGTLVAQLETFEDDQPTLETAAGGQGPLGGGGNEYGDGVGPPPGGLDHEGPIPPVFLHFESFDQDVIEGLVQPDQPTANDDMDMVVEGGDGGDVAVAAVGESGSGAIFITGHDSDDVVYNVFIVAG